MNEWRTMSYAEWLVFTRWQFAKFVVWMIPMDEATKLAMIEYQETRHAE